MPRLTSAEASLVLDHVVGDPSVPAAAANAVLAALPFPSNPTPRLLRAFLLRRVASDPVSAAALDALELLASLPSPASPVGAVHITVAAYLASSAPDFDAAAGALFARPDGRARRAVESGDTALASNEAAAVVDQFEAAVGNAFSQVVLRGLWGDRAVAEERVRDLLAAQWAAIGQSRLETAAERIVGDGAVETWSAADEVTRAKYCVLAGEQRTREIQCQLEEHNHYGNHILTPEVHKTMDALKLSCTNLQSVVEDPLPAAKAAADEVLATRMDKAVSLNAGEVCSQPATCEIAGPSAPSDNGEAPRRGTPPSLMDWNPTARTFQVSFHHVPF
ncbi:hypothetical protein GUJ93_ZPchr0279g33333 [Zizania palustris]|uniref:Uncharacterized protein n=1 Tax=Zizania palustris TaxID=103762 RepID=A0A8J5QUL1_ZIZPA|nr:hypothetical protein GUJ93_ZPchr0279g33333 [Zizania palustris]